MTATTAPEREKGTQMDLSSAITAAGSGLTAAATTNLGAVAAVVLPIAGLLIVWRVVRRAFH